MMTVDGHLLEQIKAWCAERPIRLCVLFGSQATGRTHAHSDVDLALWPTAAHKEPLDLRTELRWLRELSTLVDNEVNLAIVTPRLNPVLGFEIMRDGQVLFEAEPDLWALEAARLWHLYNDSLPFRRAMREQLREFANGVRAKGRAEEANRGA